MRILVTGSAGHLGEALVRALRDAGHCSRTSAIDRAGAGTVAVGT